MIFIQSTFRQPWRGAILSSTETRRGAVHTIVILVKADGTAPARRRLVVMHENCIKTIPPLDLTGVNPDWLRPLKGKHEIRTPPP